MSRDKRNSCDGNSGNRFWTGLLLFAAGGLLLARRLGADIPYWLFNWYTILIAIGLLISFKSGFRNAGGLIMILIGTGFMLNDIIPNANMQDFIWPGILMVVGIVFILKPKKFSRHGYDWRKHQEKWKRFQDNPPSDNEVTPEIKTEPQDDSGEYINISAVFGGVNKLIISKNFMGGEINSFMGGAEINLMQSDIKHTVQLEINNVFGGTKLLLPGNWNVKNNISAVFGGVEDKRSTTLANPDPNKTIILKGVCVFGGVEIRNFV